MTLPITERNNSSERLSSTFTISPGDGPHKTGSTSCDHWLGPNQVPGQHISDLQSLTSDGWRSPPLAHECSDEDSLVDESIENAVTDTMEHSVSGIRETFGSARRYCPIKQPPSQPERFQSGKLLNRFRGPRRMRSETEYVPSTSASCSKVWKWEIFNCVLAIGMLGSIYGILFRYDGQRIPDWGTVINLSTLIAFMATLLRMMLVFVVAQIIGQAKWKYFAGDGRPTDGPPMRWLIEASRFNDASQGLLGAAKLVPTIIRDPATLLAVIIMTISLGTGSFVQQAIQTQYCQFPVDSAHASLPISRSITTLESGVGQKSPSGSVTFSNLVAALSSALAPDDKEICSPLSVGCHTGNCTFRNSIGGVYSTLGVCSLCADTSSLITSTEWTPKCEPHEILCSTSTANYTLPNGMSVQSSFGSNGYTHAQETELLVSTELGLEWAGDLASPDMKVLSQWAFANMTVLTPNWLPTNSGYAEYVSAMCTLYPCLRSYTGSVTSGKLEEVLLSTIPVLPDVSAMFEPNITIKAVEEELSLSGSEIFHSDPWVGFKAVQSPCLVDDKSSTLGLQRLLLAQADLDPRGARRFRVENATAPAECIYSLATMVISGLSTAADSFNGRCNVSGLRNSSPLNTKTITCAEKFWLASLFADNGPSATSVIEGVEAFTDRLSNKIRLGLLDNPDLVYGQILQATVCSRIHYSWLTFPAVLVSVTSGLLGWTIFQSSRRRGREMIWKNSILPFLFYGDRFVVQNGEDVSAYSTEALQRGEPQEPLLDLDRMELEARQQVVRFNAFK